MNPKAIHYLSYGLFVLTVKEGEKDNGCIINTGIQVTSQPNHISITVNKENATHDMVKASGCFNISIISEKADFSLFQRFGFQSGRDTDKFAGFEGKQRSENGVFYVTEGTNAYISATVKQTIDLGTHTMFIAAVDNMEVLDDSPSATYTYYHANIKPKPEDTGRRKDGKTVWRCKICGYEYVGEELPEDYICPICKHPASDFEKVASGPMQSDREENREMELKYCICRHCGNIVSMVEDKGVPLLCCGEQMEELVPGTQEASQEKHLPVISRSGNRVTVTVGEEEHVMIPTHYIQWISIATNQGEQRKMLSPSGKPQAEFLLAEGEELIAAYEYCNQHGLWKTNA